MSDPNELDALLIAQFEREHTHIPAEPFVAATLRQIRGMQRRASRLRIGLRVAALLVVISVSPWLIAAADRLNVALETSLNWTADQPLAWGLALLGVVGLIGVRMRGSH